MARKKLKCETPEPRQQRSVDTIEAIFEATARILEGAEPNELTTIRIADCRLWRGTVYDYFPNKEASLWLWRARTRKDVSLGPKGHDSGRRGTQNR